MCTHMLQDFQKYAGIEHNSSDVLVTALGLVSNIRRAWLAQIDRGRK